ncbi:MAG TPA: hypothetical protein PKL49_09205 [Steroidobacteraceae bacterium]|nr:hypothetical protein [Steroidobacteraceae bacterium]HNS27414.1 hypothetical protein [Steroidobacteraceae bacterium]
MQGRTEMNRVATCLLSAILCGALPAFAADAPTNFAGTWKLDTARGENLGMMAAMQQTLVITQSSAQLVLREASDFQGQKSEREVRYDLSGAPVTNPGPMGGATETVAQWVGDKLVVTSTAEGSVAGTKTVRTETRSLSSDGRTMTVESVRGAGKPVVMVYGKVE